MAMVLIEKNGKRIKIPAGAYNKMYAPAGWQLAGEVGGPFNGKVTNTKEPEQAVANEEPVDEEPTDEWDEAEKELAESEDIDSMSMQQLQKKAAELKINTKNLSTVGAYRKAIKRALNEQ